MSSEKVLEVICSLSPPGEDTDQLGSLETPREEENQQDKTPASQPLIWPRDDINSPAHSPPCLHLPPPERPRVRSKSNYTLRILGFAFQVFGERPICARLELPPDHKRSDYKEERGYQRTISLGRMPTGQKASLLSRVFSIELNRTAAMNLETHRQYTRNHLIMGKVNRRVNAVRERLADDIDTERLFHEMRRIARQLRPWWRRCFSLKSTAGFAIYECFPDQAYHVTVDLDAQTEATLEEFYHDYTHRRVETQRRWLPWLQEHFNAGDHAGEQGKRKLGLQIVQRWSGTKLSVYASVPIALSLVLGFWYQATVDGEDNAVSQTAWTISGFVIAAASVLFAVLAAITQIGDW